jgi:hypothetical protein
MGWGAFFYRREDKNMRIFQASLHLRVLKHYYRLFPDDPLNVLLSVAYNQEERWDFMSTYRYMMDELIADSGAWSAAKGTFDITVEEVIAIFKLCKKKVDRYFNFDTDFTDKGFDNNISNQLKMEREGLHPVPVVHNFFDREIDYYVDSGKYDWLALGSTQSTNFDDLRYAVDRIRTWGNSNISIHWFGGSKYEWLVKLPIASCDTTSWARTGQFGKIKYWNPYEDKFDKTHGIYVGGLAKELKDGEYHFVTYPWRQELEEYLSGAFNISYGDLCGYEDKFWMQLVNTRFYAEQERRIDAERVKRGVPLQ